MSAVERGASINGGRTWSFFELAVDTETLDASVGSTIKPDPKWEFEDAAGHFHAYSTESGPGGPVDGLPTLEWVEVQVACDGACDLTDEDWCLADCPGRPVRVQRCRICGETVTPAVIVGGPELLRIPGRCSWRVEIPNVPARDAYDANGKIVSIVTRIDNEVSFGVAHIAHTGTTFTGGGPASCHLTAHGIGPLGRRQAIP